jgi:hypothetical protein
MRRGVRRGCIRLQGAVLGIDDEEDSNFTITVDAKVFHLQAKDAEEREIWVSNKRREIDVRGILNVLKLHLLKALGRRCDDFCIFIGEGIGGNDYEAH